MVVTKANLASYIAGLTPHATPYPIEITETIATDWGNSDISGTVGNILEDTPSGVYVDLSSTVIPNSVAIMQQTFFYCTSLVNAPVIPNSVINMQQTFYGCTSIVNAPVIPNSVTIMLQTFYGCTSIVNAPVIPNSVINMQQTFRGCTSLVNAPAIPNSVTNMQETFYNCTSLVDAPVIPNSVTNMWNTFRGCTSLKTIGSFSVDVANCDMGSAFYNCPALEAIYVPALEVDDWYLLYTDTKSTGTDYYIYDTAGTLLSSGTVAGTNQVLSVYGKSDELVISNTLTPERAIEAATTRLQHHKTGLPYNEESFVLNAKNPSAVMSNCFVIKNEQGLAEVAIGFIYTQYPNQSAPDDLFIGKWINISSSYAGDFFRAEGGNAEAFNGARQGDAMQNISGIFKSVMTDQSSGFSATGPFYNGGKPRVRGWSGENSDEVRTIGFDASRQVRTATETRPVNKTIRIWKRTA